MAENKAILDAFRASGQDFTTDTVRRADGGELIIVFFSHATLAFILDGYTVYVDPLTEYADYAALPKADLILITHEHYDHYDAKAIADASTDRTVVLGSRMVAAENPDVVAMSPGDSRDVAEGIIVSTVAAYNVSPEQLQFHPKERGDVGYVLSLGDTRIYIAGDTEPIPEMEALQNIDIMFLPVNQPYTMKPEQAAKAARMIGAPIFYPYHTGDTDLGRLEELLQDTPSIEIRVFPMQ